MIESSKCIGYYLERFGFLTNANYLAGFNRIRRDIHHLAIDNDVTVQHELTGCGTRGSDTQTEYDIVETGFEQLKEHFTFHTFGARSFLKQVSKLSFQYTVSVFGFLLFTKLNAILGSFSSLVDAVLSRGIVLLRKNFIGAKNSFAKFTSDFGSRSGISCHF